MTKKNFQDEELPHELFLTAKQKTKIRNAFPNNVLRDIKLKAQIVKFRYPKLFNQVDFLLKR